MTQTAKQWIATGLIISVVSGAAVVVMSANLMRGESAPIAQPAAASAISSDAAGCGELASAFRSAAAQLPLSKRWLTPPHSDVSLEARIDRDGDATTREPGVPTASLDSVAIGTTNVKLVLTPRS